jgi:hypothetical protein
VVELRLSSFKALEILFPQVLSPDFAEEEHLLASAKR